MRSSAGYSLLEVMVAVVILTVCIVPMAGMFDAAARGGGEADGYSHARAQADANAERITALGYREAVRLYGPDGGTGCPTDAPDDGFTCAVESGFVDENLNRTEADNATRMLVTVRVGWDGHLYRQPLLLTADAP